MRVLWLLVLLAAAIAVFLFILSSRKFNKRRIPDDTLLAMPDSFYKQKRADTLNYLVSVYPQGRESLNRLSDIELAVFYNSLWFYYNCESSFNQNLGETSQYDTPVKYCWQALPGCGDKWPRLPYSPQGYFFSFKDWINRWKPWIYSDSKIPPSYFASAVPAGPFWYWAVGPGPLFLHQRSMFRMTFDSALPSFKTWTDLTGQKHLYNQPQVLSGCLGEFIPYWKYPKNWWKGVPHNGWIEVLSSNQPPGMALSVTIMWLNGAPGSGVFYNVGKTKISRNKVDGVFRLAKEMSESEKGKSALKAAYGSINPYDIIAGLLDNPCRQSPPLVWSTEQKKAIECNWCQGGVTNGSVPGSSGGWTAKNNNIATPGIAVPITIGNQKYGRESILESRNSLESDSSQYSGNIYTFSVKDWQAYCDTNEKVPGRAADGISDKCIDDIRCGRKYLTDRISSQGSFDEAITWMAKFLEYDSVQLVQSANGSGFWQIEILEIKTLPEVVKTRDYSSFIEKGTSDCKTGDFSVGWRQDVYADFMRQYVSSFFSTRLSTRDPLDVTNDKKAGPCTSIKWDPSLGPVSGHEFNTVCNENMSSMLSHLNVFKPTAPFVWDQCSPTGKGADMKPMTTPDVPPFG